MIVQTLYRKLKQRIYRKIYVYEVSLNNTAAAESDEFRLLQMNRDLLENMIRENADEITSRKVQLLRDRIKERSHEKTFVVVDETQTILGFYHLALTDAWNATIRDIVHVPRGSVYLFDDYTFRASRKRGAHKFAVAKRLDFGRENGFQTALVQIHADNLISRKTYESMGFQRKQIIRHIRVGSWHKNFDSEIKR